MAYSPLPDTSDQSRQRTVRRLIVVLILIAVAIVALALMDRASKKPVPMPEPTAKPVQGLPTPLGPPPAPGTATSPSQANVSMPASAVNAPVELPPKEPPPPPAVLNNETLAPPAKHIEEHRKPEPSVAEDTHPNAPAEPSSTEKPGSAATPLQKRDLAQTARSFVLQLGVFSTPENAKMLQDRLAKAGIQSYTETRVEVGPFKDRGDADKARAALKNLGVKAVIVPQN